MTMDLSIELHKKKQRAVNALRSGDLRRAATLLRKVCRATPGDAQAWLLLASVHGQGGDYGGVIECCKRLLLLKPNHPQALSHLAGAHSALGQHEEAAKAFGQAVEVAPDDPIIRYNFGSALCLAGRMEEAVIQLEEALRRQPGYVEAHCALAAAYEALARYDDAKVHYRQAVELRPELLEAHCKLGGLLNATGMLEQAEACYRRALGQHPQAVELHHGLANALRYQGRFDDALAVYEQVLELCPDDAAAVSGMADLYERQGDVEAAYQQVRMLVERGDLDASGADVYLRICRRRDCCDEAIELAKALLAVPALDGGMRRTLHHSLGKLYDKLGRFDDAYVHFEAANRLLNVVFDPTELTERIDGLIAAFCPEALAAMPRATVRSDRPVFIVGMPRSGTSLVEQIIVSHPRAFGAGELNDVTDLVRSLPATLYPQCMERVPQERLDQLARRYLDRLSRLDGEALRVTDKMPGNFNHLGLIAITFPEARVIHCTRDPLDTCLSIFFQSFNVSHAYATDLANIGIYYKEYRRLMDHWKQVLDIPILDVSYAELIADQERVSREIIEFCGLEWDDRCLQFHKTERGVATASYDQVRRPIYTSSVSRWKNYEKYLGPLREALGDG